MKFDPPLISATLLKRYKRFLADVRFDDGTQATAHCANPGSMMGLAEPGSTVWLSKSDNPKRKLAWSLELVDDERSLVGVHTGKANALVEAAVTNGDIQELSGYETLRREVKYGENSRIDLLLEDPARPTTYVEVKSVTLSRTKGLAEFPDSKTTRGAKHMAELAEMAKQGHRAVVFFLVQRSDCSRMQPAADIDPKYAESLNAALAAGVEVLCYSCRLTPAEITLDRRLKVAI
ncbi:DNA/RNA nuclease SfsA [Parvibaculaceae bacterium PLY_AMNH_Bact1]|nr:DNA/RNA nuclease SfsA [Parvibaculaceae bacterium PLY_AMNH_Bact1]